MDIQQEITHQALQKALTDSFEGLAFAQVFSYRVLSAFTGDTDGLTAVYIDMPEPLAFRFVLMLTNDQVGSFFDAASGGADLTPALFADFNKEVCNTAAGHIQTILAPQKMDMLIGLPHIIKQPLDYLTPADNRCILEFEVEEYNAYVVLEKMTDAT
ncbi:hypothetical protein [Acanthopleuribacter pedis]|uniref:Chemotaxis phosphatase CheX-like domain-containing protein n=1 Tax=Acanthopleuribacter pedis TaxID=442870 RepID=A0A8J7U3H0_9BACT|nr:hypothetical protein [Acanthopleuribacter pedis]MBO1318343.1 hypothetical protein [Acanthopleuribacter pedis]